MCALVLIYSLSNFALFTFFNFIPKQACQTGTSSLSKIKRKNNTKNFSHAMPNQRQPGRSSSSFGLDGSDEAMSDREPFASKCLYLRAILANLDRWTV